MNTPRSPHGGTGPLYEHGEAGQEAAREEVVVPKKPDQDDDTEAERPTGEAQAEINREDDPPV
jgi:hypothetical protein